MNGVGLYQVCHYSDVSLYVIECSGTGMEGLMSGGRGILCYKTQRAKTNLCSLWLSLDVDMVLFDDSMYHCYKEKPAMD